MSVAGQWLRSAAVMLRKVLVDRQGERDTCGGRGLETVASDAEVL